MERFQVGKWKAGFTKLSEVEKIFPTAPDLRSIRQEMEVRSRIDEYEIEENKQQRRHQLLKYGSRIFVALVILLVGFFAISTYSEWIQ
jgi:hypothetical protein